MTAESIPTPDVLGPPGTRPSKTERTRRRLVDAVRAEVEAQGDFKAERVARRAAASPATFYNHFANKDEALAAAFEAVMDDLVALVERDLDIEGLLDRGLEDFASAWVLACVEFFRTNSATLRAAQARIPASPRLREIFRAHEAAALAHYVRFVELAQRARSVRADEAAAMAHAWMIQNQGLNHPAVLRLVPGDALHRELSRSLVRHLEPVPDADAASAGGAGR